MIDPASAAALGAILAKLLDGTAEAAGSKLLDGLASLIRRADRQGHKAPAQISSWAEAPSAAPPPALDLADLEQLARSLMATAAEDDATAADLEVLLSEARAAASRGTFNVMTGSQVSGSVVQAHDITGPITLS